MDVIFHPADFMHEDSLLLANTCHVAPEAGLAILGNELTSIFGTEYDMNQVLYVCMGYVSHLRRSKSYAQPTAGAG